MDPYHIVSDANNNVHTFYRGNNETVLQTFEENKYDLIVTSPPYADLRDYSEEGFIYNPDTLFPLLYKVLKQGGRLVWVVGDKTKDFDMIGQPMNEFMLLKKHGFKINETILYEKIGMSKPHDPVRQNKHFGCWEYMFVCSKGYPSPTRPLKDRKNSCKHTPYQSTLRQTDGSLKTRHAPAVADYSYRWNIWRYHTGNNHVDKDFPRVAEHPATFVLDLALDLLKTFSEEKMLVLDPFGGSGTVSKAAALLDRQSDYIDISQEYCNLALARMAATDETIRLLSKQKSLKEFVC